MFFNGGTLKILLGALEIQMVGAPDPQQNVYQEPWGPLNHIHVWQVSQQDK